MAAGPPSVVFPAVARFVAALRGALDLEGNWAKFLCYSHTYDVVGCPWRRAAGVPVGTVAHARQALGLPSIEDARNNVRGVIVGGVPIGSEQFEVTIMQCVADGIVSYIDKTIEQLQYHPQHLWACTVTAMQTKLDYHLRLVWPSRTEAAARAVDSALFRAAESVAGFRGALSDTHIQTRLALAARMRGGALRRRTMLRWVAYAANVVESAPAFADRTGAYGCTRVGFFPMLAELFPASAFDDPRGARFGIAIDSARSPPSVAAFVAAWQHLQGLATSAGGGSPSGPLTLTARQAGSGRIESRGLQRALTAQVEQAVRDLLHADFARLPPTDARREAWFAADRLSSQLVTAFPSERDAMLPDEFREAFTTYLGAPSHLLAPYVGRSIPCAINSRFVDQHGHELGRATLPGGSWSTVHDECERALFDLLMEAGYRFDLQPRHIFHTLIPPSVLQAPGAPPGIVPDAIGEASMPAAATARGDRRGARLPSRVLLWDVKTIYGGGAWYHTARAHDDQSGAVAARAHRVNGGASGGEYGAHARELDGLYSPPGTTPIAQRLGSFTQVRGLVFGQYAECSLDVHALIELAAHALARKHWRLSGARSEAEARSWWVGTCRRRIGVATARAMARHRIRRVPFIGVPRAVLEERMRHGPLGRGGGRQGAAGAGLPSEVDLSEFYGFQVHVRVNGD